MQTLKITGLLVLACVLAVLAMVLIKVAPRVSPAPFAPVITSFEECVAAGNPVMESYPRQCRTKDGVLFVEEVAEIPENEGIVSNGCAVAGCSGQLCVSEEEAPTIVTTCEFREEYACYREAACEPQPNGKCGWTPTSELQQCLANPPALESEFQSELQVQ
jgi:eight-cysteine-cluster-containing protein